MPFSFRNLLCWQFWHRSWFLCGLMLWLLDAKCNTAYIFILYIWWVFNKFSQVQNENTCVLHLLAEIKSCLHIWVHSSSVAISKIKVVLAESLGVLVNHCKGVTCFSELSWNSCHIIVVAMLSSKGFIKVLQSCQGFAWIMKKVAYS